MSSRVIETILARPELTARAYSPLRGDALARVERALEFRLPALIAEFYGRVGNGVFGPAAGAFLRSTPRFRADTTFVSIYRTFRAEPVRCPWPEGLLPFFDWGGGCFCCLDCSEADGAVVFSHPLADRVHYGPDDPGGTRGPVLVDRVAGMTLDAPSFDAWLQRWIDGLAVMGFEKPAWQPKDWTVDVPDTPVVYAVADRQEDFDF